MRKKAKQLGSPGTGRSRRREAKTQRGLKHDKGSG
nr:MAG TPA_asm: hypothetical protein [Caudoviricetes sp.]